MSPLTDLYDNAALRKLTTKILHTDILYKYLPSIQSKTSTLAFPHLQTHRPGHGLLEPEWLCASKYCNVPVSGNISTSQPGNRAGKRWTHNQQPANPASTYLAFPYRHLIITFYCPPVFTHKYKACSLLITVLVH